MEKFELFKLGRLVATPGVLEKIPNSDMLNGIIRHASGDWGNVCEEDARENEFSLKQGFRLMSVYKSKSGEVFWIITEADRSVTTVLLPREY